MMNRKKSRAGCTYLTYDGLLDPLGRSQVVPLLQRLSRDFSVRVVSFEKPARLRQTTAVDQMKDTLRSSGIQWKALRYHKRPRAIGTLYDLVRAALMIVLTHQRSQLIHLRSYTLGPVALLARWLFSSPIIFDMRGLWVDERFDSGEWSVNSRMLQFARAVERKLLKESSEIVTLTENSRPLLRELTNSDLSRVVVIPTLVDTDTFIPRPAIRSTNDGPISIAYLGSSGTWYDDDQLAAFIGACVRQGWQFSVMTNDPSHPQVDRFRQLGADVCSLQQDQVASALREHDAVAFFIKPSMSKIASCPTKFVEAMACGLPVVTGPGIGDVDAFIQEWQVGVVSTDSSNEMILDTLAAMCRDDAVRLRCRQLALERFSLDVIGNQYRLLYEQCLGEAAAR